VGDVNQLQVDNQDPTTLPWFSDYLAADRGAPPAYLLERSTKDLGNETFSKDRYISPAWRDLEMERLWKRTWQMACRDNDIPDIGDQIEYTIGDQSIIVVRSGSDEIRAFHNACRHRGTPLVTECNSSQEIKCPFHGWSFNLDGSLRNVPCRWDFPEVTDEAYSLVDVRVERWAGFVFINLDPNAAPLEDFIPQELRFQIEQWWPRRRWKAVHIKHEIPCNWKLAVEAFTEVYHVPVVHPETIFAVGDYNAQYDFYGPHARMLFTTATPSPALGGGVDPQDVINEMFVGEGALGEGTARVLGRDYELPKAEGDDTLLDVRRKIADMMKDVYQTLTGQDHSAVSDTECVDGYEYLIFPNFHPWGGYLYSACYRFLPNGLDPESCTYEIMLFLEMPPGVPLPRDAPVTRTEYGSLLAKQPGTEGSFGYLVDEDVRTLRRIQQGIHSDSFEAATFANLQERNLRNFHQHLERVLGL
jgi:phenylpropionate dioxygenase-like ring-hydroxylating dioxygenase large terminal subunit